MNSTVTLTLAAQDEDELQEVEVRAKRLLAKTVRWRREHHLLTGVLVHWVVVDGRAATVQIEFSAQALEGLGISITGRDSLATVEAVLGLDSSGAP